VIDGVLCSEQQKQTKGAAKLKQLKLKLKSHVDFDSFTVYVSISIQKILKRSLQPKLKGASVWLFNARSKAPTG